MIVMITPKVEDDQIVDKINSVIISIGAWLFIYLKKFNLCVVH
jgi:hypothetical protein